MQRANWVFAPGLASIPQARTLITEKLSGLPDDALQVVLLLASELVTNAVRHGDGQVRVHVAWGDEDVRVDVEDRSPKRPVVRPLDHEALGGRGLILVDGLSSHWGVLDGDSGKTVWFSLDV